MNCLTMDFSECISVAKQHMTACVYMYETVPWACCKGSAKLPHHKNVVPAVLMKPFPWQSSSYVAFEGYATEVESHCCSQGASNLSGHQDLLESL